MRQPSWRAESVVSALLLVLVVAVLPTSYAVERPGPVFDTLGTTSVDGRTVPVISVSGATTHPTRGSLDALTVSVVGTPASGPGWLDLAAAWLDRTQAIVPLSDVYAPGVSEQQADQEGAEEMTDSQQSAVAAALIHLGYAVTSTVRVDDVVPGTAASGVLRTGDVIRTYSGATVTAGCALQQQVQSGGARRVVIGVRRAGRDEALAVSPRLTDEGGGVKVPLLGIETGTTFTFPISVTLRLGDVGGPSAGMMFALGVIDELTPGSLTGGRHVAGTGTICPDGAVGAIGGIAQKMAGARAAGATVFLAPKSNCADVSGHVPAGLEVFAVSTLDDSLRVLSTLAAGGSTSDLARCSPQVESGG